MVARRWSDIEIDWNLLHAPSLAFGGIIGGSLACLEGEMDAIIELCASSSAIWSCHFGSRIAKLLSKHLGEAQKIMLAIPPQPVLEGIADGMLDGSHRFERSGHGVDAQLLHNLASASDRTAG